MQQSSFDLDKLFSNKETEETDFNKEVFRKAALLFDFDIESDFVNYDSGDLELLKKESNLKKDGKYFLNDEVRNKILTDLLARQDVQQEIEKHNIQGEYSKMLMHLVSKEHIKYDDFQDSELYYLLNLAPLFPSKLNLETLKYELLRRHHFVPFREIIKNFAGREKELQLINDYIDWLPKEGIINIARGFIRNVINWHDKLPIVIQGIGGIGKSSLISKIIIDNNNAKNGKLLPFVYIDFDVPGFSLAEPMSILLEGLRQLSFQFPEQRVVFSDVSRDVSDKINTNSENNNSTQSQRGNIYGSIENLLVKYEVGLNQINHPILVVFDSFEEIQYRASREELSNFFSFIREISEKLPRIRLVIAGRSEIEESLADFKFDKISLTEFDRESAISLLGKYGLTDELNSIKIFDAFGGNPLMLLLAADLVKKDPTALSEISTIINKKKEYLINRILEHIHDPDVRKMAIPGLLVRRITPEVIKHVLAGPCELGDISIERATELFNELRKEVALISKSSDAEEIVFRQDLRMACEAMIKSGYPTASEHIYRKAIEYYQGKKAESEKYEAEFYFHILKGENNIEQFTKSDYLRLRTKLESALVELPASSKMYLRSLSGSQVETKIVNQTGDFEWTNYYIPQIRQGLNGNLDFLKKLETEISNRNYDMQAINSEFLLYDVLLKQRLNNLSKSNDLIEEYIKKNVSSRQYSNTFYQLYFLKAHNLEYAGDYEKALEICEEVSHDRNYETDELHRNKFSLLISRLKGRIGIPSTLDIKIGDPNQSKLNGEFKDTNWVYALNHVKEANFLKTNDFNNLKEKRQLEITDISILEEKCYNLLGVYVKDIALAGNFQIVLDDYLHVLEIRGFLLTSPSNYLK